MIHTTHRHTGGYSIIASILMIGFLLVLTTSTLNLVLQEMKDGKGRQNYIKAYSAAEGAMELALLKIKKKGYGYDVDANNLNLLKDGNKDPLIGYSFESKIDNFSGSLSPYETEIIPLFWIDTGGNKNSISQLDFTSASGLIWNIIASKGGISGIGSFNTHTFIGEKSYDEGTGKLNFLSGQSVGGFLSLGESYLTLYNPNGIDINYSLSTGLGEYLTKPQAVIYSTATIDKYTQNIKTRIDNTEFLGI